MTGDEIGELDQILRPYLPYLGPGVALDQDDRLNALGLDSLGTVQLLVDLEDAFGFTFTDEHLGPDTFATVRSLSEVVAALRGEQSGWAG